MRLCPAQLGGHLSIDDSGIHRLSGEHYGRGCGDDDIFNHALLFGFISMSNGATILNATFS